jgi:hypothetical protein
LSIDQLLKRLRKLCPRRGGALGGDTTNSQLDMSFTRHRPLCLGLGYDTANRRTSITYPNGVVTTTGFDAANEILSLSYDHGATHIGDLAYTYDTGGRQISESGSFAQINTPTAIAAMTYCCLRHNVPERRVGVVES